MLGVITARQMQFRVDIGAHVAANLSEVAFEGATKRNRPNLQVQWSMLHLINTSLVLPHQLLLNYNCWL